MSHSEVSWRGVMPAITTPFDEQGAIDHAFLSRHVTTLVRAGATGIIPFGSLGEGATLSFDEKRATMKTLVEAAGACPVIAGIASASTREAEELARMAREEGGRGLMVLPPYLYPGTAEEIEHHVAAILSATELPAMLYNNPIAYGVDFSVAQVARLASEHENLGALKESSGDVRRITAVHHAVGDSLAVFVGLDDYLVEGVRAGAQGWVAGLVNALPEESMRLFALAESGEDDAALDELYAWFLPLLRLDTVPRFVQLIKLVQAAVDLGSERVRAPRRMLQGDERDRVQALIDGVLQRRPRS